MISVGLLFILLIGGNVNASSFYLSYEDNFELPNPMDSKTWTFDLLNGIPGPTSIDDNDIIEKANLTISLFDEENAAETGAIYLDMDTISWNSFTDVVRTPDATSFGELVTAYFSTDYILEVAIKKSSGRFWVDYIRLSGEYTAVDNDLGSASTSATHAPEPTTIFLFGFGLLSLSGISRRRKK